MGRTNSCCGKVVEVRRVENRIVMSSLDSCLTNRVVITSFLVIIFTNLASDHPFVHGQPINFSFTSFNSTSIDEIILLDDAALDFSDYVVLNALSAATGTVPGCGKLMYKEKVQMFYPSTGAVASFQTSHVLHPSCSWARNWGWLCIYIHARQCY